MQYREIKCYIGRVSEIGRSLGGCVCEAGEYDLLEGLRLAVGP
jgi:hypothetical protein